MASEEHACIAEHRPGGWAQESNGRGVEGIERVQISAELLCIQADLEWPTACTRSRH